MDKYDEYRVGVKRHTGVPIGTSRNLVHCRVGGEIEPPFRNSLACLGKLGAIRESRKNELKSLSTSALGLFAFWGTKCGSEREFQFRG